jgi:hypothetical protein
MKKAFDMVNYYKLFQFMLNAGVNMNVVNVLKNMYECQRLSILWDGCQSEVFACRNGLRQGSPLSPFLFNVYMDGVLNDIGLMKHGCRISGYIVNVLAYIC